MPDFAAGRQPVPAQEGFAANAEPAVPAYSAQDLAAMIDRVADALISVDEGGRIVQFNAAASKMLACPAAQALGAPISQFIPEGLRPVHEGHVQSFAQQPDSRPAAAHAREVWALRADGHSIPVEVAVSAVKLGDGTRSSLLSTAVLRELSTRKALEAELHRVSKRYQTVVEQSPDAIWLEEGGRLKLANAACAALLGAPSTAILLDMHVTDFLPDWSPPDGTQRRRAKPRRFETRVRRLDGALSEVELSMADVPDHGGEATQGVMRDITQRKLAEARLQRTQAGLLEAHKIAHLGYFNLDVATMHWWVSPQLQALLGGAAPVEAVSNLHSSSPVAANLASDFDGALALDFESGLLLVHADDRDALRHYFLHDMLKGHTSLDREYRIVRQDNHKVRWVHGRGQVHVDAEGRATHMFGTLQDITERKLSALALDRSRRELRRLSNSLTQAREDERRHVARELHDELGQRLSALKLEMASLLDQPGLRDTKACDRMRPLLSEVDGALSAVRRIAANLRPPMLDDLGLSAALEWLCNDWARRTGLNISMQIQALDELLNESATTTVYRIVQEALTNVSRHAQARHVQVGLQRHVGELLVWVEDDGVGLSPGDTDKRNSNGLAGIRERAHILGGAARIINASQGGCRLEARLPLDRVDTSPQDLLP